jgi:thymidylate kinase
MGLIIGLSGVDGSGKTTAAKYVVDRLKKQGFKVIYHHELDYILLKPIFRLTTKLMGSKRAESAKTHSLRNMEKSKPFYSGLYYFLVLVDNLISYLYFKFKRGIIVHDRWPYDIPAIFPYRHYKNRFIEKLLLNFPRPDILILLKIPPEIALLRKNEDPSEWHQSLDFYESIGARISAIACQLKYDAVINSNRPIDEVAGDILTVIISLSKLQIST